MPIYAYRCTACGHAKDVLQKMSDPVLTQCTSCGEQTFVKQVTAAGFQLKGSGWYVTDFRGDSKSSKASDGVVSADSAKDGSSGGDTSAAPAPAAKSESGSTASAAPAAAPSPVSAPAAAPASSGGSAAASK